MDKNSIFIVVAVISVIFIGIAFYLFSIDKKIGRLEKENRGTDDE